MCVGEKEQLLASDSDRRAGGLEWWQRESERVGGLLAEQAAVQSEPFVLG